MWGWIYLNVWPEPITHFNAIHTACVRVIYCAFYHNIRKIPSCISVGHSPSGNARQLLMPDKRAQSGKTWNKLKHINQEWMSAWKGIVNELLNWPQCTILSFLLASYFCKFFLFLQWGVDLGDGEMWPFVMMGGEDEINDVMQRMNLCSKRRKQQPINHVLFLKTSDTQNSHETLCMYI